MIKNNRRYFITGVLLSLILITTGFMVISITFAGIGKSISIIARSHEIKLNPDSITSETRDLTVQLMDLRAQRESIKALKYPDLSTFSEIADKFHVKLVGINLKNPTSVDKVAEQVYALIFQGEIAGLLDALDHIERNLAIQIDAITLVPSAGKTNEVDMGLKITIPEKSGEVGKD
jgi:hypothetical protein